MKIFKPIMFPSPMDDEGAVHVFFESLVAPAPVEASIEFLQWGVVKL